MAKSYKVLSGAWTKTKDGETVYLTPRIQHTIADHLTKARIKELVAGGVLKEYDSDNAWDIPTDAPPQSAGGFLWPFPSPPDPPNPDLQWLQTRDGRALSVGPSRYNPRNPSTTLRALMVAFERLADVRDEDPVPLREFIQKHGALLLCAGCGREPLFHPGGPLPNTPCVQHDWEAWEPLVYLSKQPAREHLIDTYRAYARMLRAARLIAKALRTHIERDANFRAHRTEVLWREVCRELPVKDNLWFLVGDRPGTADPLWGPFHNEWHRGKSHLGNTRKVLGACLSWWLQCGRSTPMVQWQSDGPKLTLHFHNNVRLGGIGLWEDLAEGLWEEVVRPSRSLVRCANHDISEHYFERTHQPGRPSKYCPSCQRASVPARDKSRRHRRRHSTQPMRLLIPQEW